jgi:hypothetical protein
MNFGRRKSLRHAPARLPAPAALGFMILAACIGKKNPFKPSAAPGTVDEYDVYRAVVADTNYFRSACILLADSTMAYMSFGNLDYWKEHMPSLSDETITAYLSVNATRARLQPIACPGKTCVLIGKANPYDWRNRNPGESGLVTVSRVGFNRTGTQALVYWSEFWAPLAASGSMMLLEKIEGRWVVRRSLMIWIS